MNGDISFIRETLASGAAVCAYIPIISKPTGDDAVSKERWTEMSTAFTANCLRTILRHTKAISKSGTIEQLKVLSR
jgi:hypothetical protein